MRIVGREILVFSLRKIYKNLIFIRIRLLGRVVTKSLHSDYTKYFHVVQIENRLLLGYEQYINYMSC